MTRINANISPSKLIDQHLLAEYREIVRIPTLVNKRKDHLNIPESFRLNTGHVKYFYDKIQFLHKRFNLLKQELEKRNIVNNIDDSCFLSVKSEFYNDIDHYKLKNGNDLIRERIEERIKNMKSEPKYYKNKISKEEAIKLIKQ